LFEPMFWFVDHFTDALGPVFVIAVTLALATFVAIAYAIGIPFWAERSYFILIVGLTIGNYLLINVVFHYYMALTTPPGNPPDDVLIPEAVSICKKCIAPKPPRAHHCSVCNKCVLKMDHHCPWLHNCVGHYNHRHFFMFCAFVWCGTIFVFFFGILVAYDEWFGASSIERDLEQKKWLELSQAHNNTLLRRPWSWANFRHGLIVFEVLSAGGVFVAVGGLMAWHALLITRGETCVESYINDKEKKRLKALGLSFRSPFDRGVRENWRVFLGFRSGHSWRHVLWPSAHKPLGDGLVWEYARNPVIINFNALD